MNKRKVNAYSNINLFFTILKELRNEFPSIPFSWHKIAAESAVKYVTRKNIKYKDKIETAIKYAKNWLKISYKIWEGRDV